ncbi:MAG: serine/threonine protein kinase [Micrococcales bacterium]|nr:serine/threonine protein kinase [Micrococcales bacterium]
MRVREGVLLGDRYLMVRLIAVGGMGEVWEGRDESLGRPVAVKALRPEYAGESTLLQRFRVEARNSAALSHPNIAPLFDYGEDAGTAYLVMELVPGQPLSDILDSERVLEPQRLLPILSQAARGLHYAHQMGVVHRDVKPGNLLVEPGGRVRITDFGVSQAINQTPLTATGMVMGTAQYLSPEQAVGRPATNLSDLYALGIIAYEALAGERPFTGTSPVDIAIAQVNDPPPPLPASVEPRLASLVMRLLDKEPARRPQSGDELAALFDSLIASTPPAGVPVAARAAAPPLRSGGEPQQAKTVLPEVADPPSFVPRSPVTPDRGPIRTPVTIGPRRLGPARGSRARSATDGLLSRLRTGGARRAAPAPAAPLWLRWALLVAVVVVVIWALVALGRAISPGDTTSSSRSAAIVVAIPIPSSPSTACIADDSGGQL